jgi:hypothetical protein
MSNSHIPLEEMLEDLRITKKEIKEYEDENEVLFKNYQRNRTQIYLNDGRILQRKNFVTQLEKIIKEEYPQYNQEEI